VTGGVFHARRGSTATVRLDCETLRTAATLFKYTRIAALFRTVMERYRGEPYRAATDAGPLAQRCYIGNWKSAEIVDRPKNIRSFPSC
jgi:hypothetical protein